MHTQGPWVIDDRQIIAPEAVLSDLRVIATIHVDTEYGANTRLFAASPDMIAALEAVVSMHCSQDGHYRDNIGAMNAARAAIAKARGE